MFPDFASDLLMLVLIVVTMATFVTYARRFNHIWLGACIVPLMWFAYYYALQLIGHDAQSREAMRLFRPTLAMLFIFFSAFVARDRVEGFVLACAMWIWELFYKLYCRAREVKSKWMRR